MPNQQCRVWHALTELRGNGLTPEVFHWLNNLTPSGVRRELLREGVQLSVPEVRAHMIHTCPCYRDES